MQPSFDSGLVWFRRDLRIEDQPALSHALLQCKKVYCTFLFDRDILDPLPRQDRRVEFIWRCVEELDARLRELSGRPDVRLIVQQGKADLCIPRLAHRLQVQAVFAAHDYEPQAIGRDQRVRGQLAQQGISWVTYKDHVVFEGREILTRSATPYGVYTPYRKAWMDKLGDGALPEHRLPDHAGQVLASVPNEFAAPVPTLSELGFESTNLSELRIPTGTSGARTMLDDFVQRMDSYDQARDFPAVKGPSYLGVHLRFGTVSVRSLVRLARERMALGSAGAAVWLGELIWRDFYFQILSNFPHVVDRAFKPEYDAIQWVQGKQAETLFAAWKEGRTGYPLVDAAMAQLNQTGYMHNRLRMVSGSFLVKHLGVDWRWGEHYFAQHLNDYELASNNGGWQWVSSSGCDAQPYFRIFNPVTQSEKFDAQGRFIRRYVPALASLDDRQIHAPWQVPKETLRARGVVLGRDYPAPVVDHAQARADTLQRYSVVKKTSEASRPVRR